MYGGVNQYYQDCAFDESLIDGDARPTHTSSPRARHASDTALESRRRTRVERGASRRVASAGGAERETRRR
jgi:hypothetical protein